MANLLKRYSWLHKVITGQQISYVSPLNQSDNISTQMRFFPIWAIITALLNIKCASIEYLFRIWL